MTSLNVPPPAEDACYCAVYQILEGKRDDECTYKIAVKMPDCRRHAFIERCNEAVEKTVRGEMEPARLSLARAFFEAGNTTTQKYGFEGT